MNSLCKNCLNQSAFTIRDIVYKCSNYIFGEPWYKIIMLWIYLSKLPFLILNLSSEFRGLG